MTDVKRRLLAEECPRCNANTLYTFTLKIVWVTNQPTYPARQAFRKSPPSPEAETTKASKLAGARKCANVDNYAKKMSNASKEVSRKRKE